MQLNLLTRPSNDDGTYVLCSCAHVKGSVQRLPVHQARNVHPNVLRSGVSNSPQSKGGCEEGRLRCAIHCDSIDDTSSSRVRRPDLGRIRSHARVLLYAALANTRRFMGAITFGKLNISMIQRWSHIIGECMPHHHPRCRTASLSSAGTSCS